MPPQVVWPEMDPHQGPGLFDHDPGGGIGDGENSLASFSASGLEVILQPIGQLLGDEDDLRLLATFWVPDYEFLVLHIPASKLENLAYPHTTPGHEFQHEAVSYFGGPEDDLVDGLFFLDLPMHQLPRPKEFLQHRGVTGILELSVQIIADEVEEGLEIGVTSMLG